MGSGRLNSSAEQTGFTHSNEPPTSNYGRQPRPQQMVRTVQWFCLILMFQCPGLSIAFEPTGLERNLPSQPVLTMRSFFKSPDEQARAIESKRGLMAFIRSGHSTR